MRGETASEVVLVCLFISSTCPNNGKGRVFFKKNKQKKNTQAVILLEDGRQYGQTKMCCRAHSFLFPSLLQNEVGCCFVFFYASFPFESHRCGRWLRHTAPPPNTPSTHPAVVVVAAAVGVGGGVGLKAGHWDKWWDKGQGRALIMTTVKLGRVCRWQQVGRAFLPAGPPPTHPNPNPNPVATPYTSHPHLQPPGFEYQEGGIHTRERKDLRTRINTCAHLRLAGISDVGN